jgi:hypothetical protein
MNMLTNIRRLGALTVAVFILSTLAAIAPASAQEAEEPADDVGVAQVAPPCIERYWHEHGSREAHATNYCPTGYYIKFIIAYGPDSGCYFVSQFGGSAYWWWRVGWPFDASRLDRVELC